MRPWGVALALLLGLAAMVWWEHAAASRLAIAALRVSSSDRLDLYAESLQSELRRGDALPQVVALDHEVIALLLRPDDPARRQSVNRYLETVSLRAGAAAVYVMDSQGLTLAASNWGQGIVHPGRTVGVVAVKLTLDKIDRPWQRASEKVLVVDGNGVIFLSWEPAWRFKTLTPLSHEAIRQMATTRQYAEAGALSPIGIEEQHRLDDQTALVTLTAPAARTSARTSAVVAGLLFVLVAVVALYFVQRRRFVAELVQARTALRAANNQLEVRVARRTQDLSDANQLLRSEVAERERAEATLKATLDDLVQTAKMAVLGRLSAGITHELNQPLQALRTLSDNAVVFLQRGQHAQAQAYLSLIGELSGYMGKITSQLKKFARKAPPVTQAVAVAAVVQGAVFLLSQTGRAQPAEICVLLPDGALRALCDATRLEQVVVNLVSNALDAVAGCDAGRVEVRVRRGDDADWVLLEVHDNAPGIAEACAAHLFEPFFTTKEQGAGLGLGLTISEDIARGFGGRLSAQASPLGGALFVLHLPAASETETAHA